MSSDLKLVMSQAVAQLCHQVGFSRVSESALQLLCDVGEQYLQHLSLVIYRVASLCESEPHLDDGLLALRLLGENPQCLLKFMLDVGPSFVKPPRLLCGPRLGRIRLDVPPDDHPFLPERPVYIPRHLPVTGWQEEKGTNNLDTQSSDGARTTNCISASLVTKSQSDVGSTASTSLQSRRPAWAGQISYQLTRISVDPVTKSLVEHAPPEKLPPPELPVTGDYFSSSFRGYPSDTSGSLRSLSPPPHHESITASSTLSSSYQGASDAAWAAALQAKPASRVLFATKRFDPSAVTTTSSRLSNGFSGRSATSTAAVLSTLGGSSKKRMAPITVRAMSIAKKPKLSGDSSVNTAAVAAVAVTSKRRRRRTSVARKRARTWRLRKASTDSAVTAVVVGQSEKVTVDPVVDDSQWERKPTAAAGDHHHERQAAEVDSCDPMASKSYELAQSPVPSPAASSHTSPVGAAHYDSRVDSGSDKTPPAESPLAALRMRKSGSCETDRHDDDGAAVDKATVLDASLDIIRQRPGSPPSPSRSWLTTGLPATSHRSCSTSPTTRAASPPTFQASKSSVPTPGKKSGLGKWHSSTDSVTPSAENTSVGKAKTTHSHSALPRKRLKSRNRQAASRPSIISSLFGNPLRQKGSKITIDKPYKKPEVESARRQKEQKLQSAPKASTSSASITDQSTVINATSHTGPFASSRQTKRSILVKRNSRTRSTTNQRSSPHPRDLPGGDTLSSRRPGTTIDSPGSDGTEAMTDVDRAELLRIPSTTSQDERKALTDDRVKPPFTSFVSCDSFGKARASSLILPASIVSRVRRRSASLSPLSSIDSTSSSLSSSSSTSCLSPIPVVKHSVVEVAPGSPRSGQTAVAGQQQLSSDRQGKASPEGKPRPMVISATCPPPLLPISSATLPSLRRATPVTDPPPAFPPPTLYPVASEESCTTMVNSQLPHQTSADSSNTCGGGGGLRIKIRFNASVGGVSEVPIVESPSRIPPLISSLSPSSSSSSSSLSSSSTPVSPYIAPPRQIAATGTSARTMNESVSLVSGVDDSHVGGHRTGSASPTCATSSDAGKRTPLLSVKKNPKLVIRLGSGPTVSSSSVSCAAADSDSCHSSSCFKPAPQALSPRRWGKLDCEPSSVAPVGGGVRTGFEGQQQLTISRLAHRGGQLDSRASSSSSGTESLLSSGDEDEDEASASASVWKLATYSTAVGARLPPPPCLERLPTSAAAGSTGGAGAGSERDRRRPDGLPQLLPIHHQSAEKPRRGEEHLSSCSFSAAAAARPSQLTPSVRPVEANASKLPRARVDTIFTDDDDDGDPEVARGDGPKALPDWPSLRTASKKDTSSSGRPASVSTPSPAVPKATRQPGKAKPPRRSRHQQSGSDQPQQSLPTQPLNFSSSNSSAGSLNTTSTTTKQQIVVPSAGSSYYFDNNGQQIWLCPVCLLEDDGNLMIGCDSCDDWYHSTCLGLSVEPEVAQWFCPKCSGRPLASVVPVPQSAGFPTTVPSTVAVEGAPSAAHLPPSLSYKQRSSTRGGITTVSGKAAKRRGAKRKA